jgi:hypothetical protein
MTERCEEDGWLRCFGTRMVRASLLDSELYEEVEADPRTLGQAALVVLLSACAAGIGGFANGGYEGILLSAVAALVGWWIWAYAACLIGTRLLPEPHTSSNHGELLRTIGFSSAPGMLRVLGLIPGLNPWLYAVTGVWMLVAMVIAVRQALDYSNSWRAIAVCIIGAPIEMVLILLSFLVVGPWPV